MVSDFQVVAQTARAFTYPRFLFDLPNIDAYSSVLDDGYLMIRQIFASAENNSAKLFTVGPFKLAAGSAEDCGIPTQKVSIFVETLWPIVCFLKSERVLN